MLQSKKLIRYRAAVLGIGYESRILGEAYLQAVTAADMIREL
jgi:hypothetical protein